LFLAEQPIGTFLIRFSGSRAGAFVLDYVREPGAVRSVRLTSHPNGGFAALISGGDTKERVFKSLHELVETYTLSNILRIPLTSSLTQQPWFYGDVSREEADVLLQGQPPGTFLLRFSNQVGCFAASFIGSDGEVKRGLITRIASGNGYQVKGQGIVYPSLSDLVKQYKEEHIFSSPLEAHNRDG